MLGVLSLCFFLTMRRPPSSTRTDTLFPYTTRFRSVEHAVAGEVERGLDEECAAGGDAPPGRWPADSEGAQRGHGHAEHGEAGEHPSPVDAAADGNVDHEAGEQDSKPALERAAADHQPVTSGGDDPTTDQVGRSAQPDRAQIGSAH